MNRLVHRSVGHPPKRLQGDAMGGAVIVLAAQPAGSRVLRCPGGVWRPVPRLRLPVPAGLLERLALR